MRKFYSPLRYPGGKSKLGRFIALLCEANEIKNPSGHYVEPYAGGASVALFLLLNNRVAEITINDSDRAIYAFWYSVLNDPEKLIRKIQRTEVSLETWEKCRRILKKKEAADLHKLGFATFFLNRTNVSGIIDGGVIGGQRQKGKYKIDCRFNKVELIKRIRAIAAREKDIHLHNLDAVDLIKEVQRESAGPDTIFYFDPPYYLKGESLYLNYYEHEDHDHVSKAIGKIKNSRWVVSYDGAEEIKKLYSKYRSIEYMLLHTARTARLGDEVLFFSENMIVPDVLDPTKV